MNAESLVKTEQMRRFDATTGAFLARVSEHNPDLLLPKSSVYDRDKTHARREEVLRLYRDGVTFDEIAERWGCSRQAATDKYKRALKFLHNIADPQDKLGLAWESLTILRGNNYMRLSRSHGGLMASVVEGIAADKSLAEIKTENSMDAKSTSRIRKLVEKRSQFTLPYEAKYRKGERDKILSDPEITPKTAQEIMDSMSYGLYRKLSRGEGSPIISIDNALSELGYSAGVLDTRERVGYLLEAGVPISVDKANTSVGDVINSSEAHTFFTHRRYLLAVQMLMRLNGTKNSTDPSEFEKTNQALSDPDLTTSEAQEVMDSVSYGEYRQLSGGNLISLRNALYESGFSTRDIIMDKAAEFLVSCRVPISQAEAKKAQFYFTHKRYLIATQMLMRLANYKRRRELPNQASNSEEEAKVGKKYSMSEILKDNPFQIKRDDGELYYPKEKEAEFNEWLRNRISELSLLESDSVDVIGDA